MEVIFDSASIQNNEIKKVVNDFLDKVSTIEKIKNSPVIIFQDGKSKSYYIKCSIQTKDVFHLFDINAKLDPKDKDSYRANRELLLEHNTYKRMVSDAKEGREFNDIILEYNKQYNPNSPLKIWGGQHRVKAILDSFNSNMVSRFHGFRIFFNLAKKQRTELALISNTNILVSNDLFDRLQEETYIGLELRKWCISIGFLKEKEDFPDLGSRSDKITVNLARTFITNYYKGKEKSLEMINKELDKNIYEPYLCESGLNLDTEYTRIVDSYPVWNDKELVDTGIAFRIMHEVQYKTIKDKKNNIPDRKSFRNKALTKSVLSAWSFIAGLLQNDKNRLMNHYDIPKTNKKILDPLNSQEMSQYHHTSDAPSYRGLGTRSGIIDRQRMAQLFLAKSLIKSCVIDRQLMHKAVSQVVGLKALENGYKK